jgi:hypothetical protein
MQQKWKWLLPLAAVLPPLAGSIPALAQVPDVTRSYFVPQSGPVGPLATEGAAAIANARRCPNDDGIQVLKNNARLMVVVIDDGPMPGLPIAGIPASDICVLFNGGTPAQGFSGVGDDSIMANAQFNPIAQCPDVLCVQADGPTDAAGVTYITWLGPTKDGSGNAIRDPSRKWGMYAGDIPVRVIFGSPPVSYFLMGRLTSASPNGTYTAHVKSLDTVVTGVAPFTNSGELVSTVDVNPVQAVCVPGQPYQYKLDFNNDGLNTITGDLNFIKAHITPSPHRCNFPMNP